MDLRVIGVAGGIGSGKTVFAQLLTSRLGGQFVSFGDFVRSKAAERALGSDRAVLQELGERLIAEMGWERFASAVLAPWHRRGHLVVDGVRHLEALVALRTLAAPAVFRLVYLDADPDTRRSRLSERASDADNLSVLDAHSTERAVHWGLRSAADLVIDARLAPEALADTAARIVVQTTAIV